MDRVEGLFSDGMPLKNTGGDVCLVFSGEEYSDYRIAHATQNGNRSNGSSEAGYLLQRYEQDRNFFQDLNGMFHGLVADRARGVVTLFNDRYNMHRLSYHQASDTFYSAARRRRFWPRVPNCAAWTAVLWESSFRLVVFSKIARFSKTYKCCRPHQPWISRMLH